jgi:hypothetical protein
MLENNLRYEAMQLYTELIEYQKLCFWTPRTLKAELDWVMGAGGCAACGTIQPDCAMTWIIDEEAVASTHVPGIDLLSLCRPRQWFCAYELGTLTPRGFCASCYRLVRYECIEGVWVPEVIIPSHLQMILPFREGLYGGSLP